MAKSFWSKKVCLFTDYYSRDMVSSSFSLVNLLSILVWFLIIVLPFVVAFSSGDLWQKGDTYSEQPIVNFNGKYYAQLLFVSIDDTGKREQIQFDYCSVKSIRDNIQNSLATPILRTSAWDIDRDGAIDQLNITLRFKKPLEKLQLQKVNIILAFDYELQDLIKMKMEGLAIIDVDTQITPMNPSKIITQGPIIMKQPSALPQLPNQNVRDIYDDNYFNTLEAVNMQQFIYNYQAKRNETLQYPFRKSINYGAKDDHNIDVEMIYRIPANQNVVYIPTFWQVIKFAWIRYFSVFILYYFLLYKLFLNHVVTGGVFETVEITELNMKNIR